MHHQDLKSHFIEVEEVTLFAFPISANWIALAGLFGQVLANIANVNGIWENVIFGGKQPTVFVIVTVREERKGLVITPIVLCSAKGHYAVSLTIMHDDVSGLNFADCFSKSWVADRGSADDTCCALRFPLPALIAPPEIHSLFQLNHKTIATHAFVSTVRPLPKGIFISDNLPCQPATKL
jgi:hypothetical protein